MLKKSQADRIAVAVAVLAVIVGGVLVGRNGPRLEAPTKTTTVTERGSGAGVGKKTALTETQNELGQGEGGQEVGGTDPETKKKALTVETPTGKPSGKITKTTEVSPRSFVERALGNGGLVLLVIGAILLVAFLAAAFAQRLLVGDFALKIGPLELSAVQAKAEEPLVKLTGEVATLSEAQVKDRKDIKVLKRKVAGTSENLATIGVGLAELNSRLAKLEEKQNG